MEYSRDPMTGIGRGVSTVRVPPVVWQRTGTHADGVHFTVESFGRYLLHDPIHHLQDVAEGYATLAGRA
jgi:hypothetical protein